MAELDLQAIHDEMVSVAYEAGKMIMAANPQDIGSDTKLNCEKSYQFKAPATMLTFRPA